MLISFFFLIGEKNPDAKQWGIVYMMQIKVTKLYMLSKQGSV